MKRRREWKNARMTRGRGDAKEEREDDRGSGE